MDFAQCLPCRTICAYALLSDGYRDESYKFLVIGTAPDGRRFIEPFELRACEMLGRHAQSIIRLAREKVKAAVERIEAQAATPPLAGLIAICNDLQPARRPSATSDGIPAEGAD